MAPLKLLPYREGESRTVFRHAGNCLSGVVLAELTGGHMRGARGRGAQRGRGHWVLAPVPVGPVPDAPGQPPAQPVAQGREQQVAGWLAGLMAAQQPWEMVFDYRDQGLWYLQARRAGYPLMPGPVATDVAIPCWLYVIVQLLGFERREQIAPFVEAHGLATFPEAIDVVVMTRLLRDLQVPLQFVAVVPVAEQADGPAVEEPRLLFARHQPDGAEPTVVFAKDYGQPGPGHFWLARVCRPTGRHTRFRTMAITAQVTALVDAVCLLSRGAQELYDEFPLLQGPVGPCPVCLQPAPTTECGHEHGQHANCVFRLTWNSRGVDGAGMPNGTNPERDLPLRCFQCYPRPPQQALDLVPEVAIVAPVEPERPVQRPEDFGLEAWSDLVILTGTYLEDFPHVHQCLYDGGRAVREASRRYPGPTCTCGLHACQVGNPCPHLLLALVSGQQIWVVGWQFDWARKLSWLSSRIRFVHRETAVPACRAGVLYHVHGLDEHGYDPEALVPYPAPVLMVADQQPMAVEREVLGPVGARVVAYRPSLTIVDVVHRVSNGVTKFAHLRQACGGFVSGLAMMGLVKLTNAILDKAPLILGRALTIKQSAVVLGCRVAVACVPLFLPRRIDCISLSGLMAYALTGPLQFVGAAVNLLTALPGIEAVTSRPQLEQLVDFGAGGPQRAMAQEYVNRATIRQIGGTDLAPALLQNVAARLDWPQVTRMAVETALAPYQGRYPGYIGPRSGEGMLTGAAPYQNAQPKRSGPLCRACARPLSRKKHNHHLCDVCLNCLPGRKGQAVEDHRREVILKESLSVTERAPLVPIMSQWIPPPCVERRDLWRTVVTTYIPRLHEAEIRRQNCVKRAVLVGVGHPGHFPGVFQRGAESMYNGLATRTYREVMQPQHGAFAALTVVRDAIFREVPRGVVAEMDKEEWFAEQDREMEMREADFLLARDGWLPEDRLCKPFIKSEFHYMGAEGPHGSVGFKLEGKPRPIYTLSDKTQVKVGRWTRPLMGFFKEHLGPRQLVQYCGCNTPGDNQRVLRELQTVIEAGGKCWLNDFTCFETTQNRRTMALVRELYRQVWIGFDEEREMAMDWWEAPFFRTQSGGHRFSGQLPEMMCSGRSDTAITNSLLNAIATVAAHASARLGCDLWELVDYSQDQILEAVRGMRMYFVGDDSVVSGPPGRGHYEVRVQEAYEAMGFMCKLERVERLQDVVFLGNRPYWVEMPNGLMAWAWGPTLGRRMYKHHFVLDGNGDPFTWLQNVVQMEVQTCGHVPILGTLARRMRELLGAPRKLKKSQAARLEREQKYKMSTMSAGKPVKETFEVLAGVYGVSARSLLEIDIDMAHIPSVPYLYSHPTLDRIFWMDN